MTNLDWERVKELFGAASELPAAERAAWLEAECGHDPALRREVEELLASSERAEGFLDGPAGDVPPAPSLIGRHLGPWRLEAEIGRGGMGAVYLGVREEAGFRQEAALKVVRAGWLSESLSSRFERERRILARLRHPGIASLLDGGTTEAGEPWLAMEYVEGLPLDRYAEEHALSTCARLERLREADARLSTLDAEGLAVGLDRVKVQEAAAERAALERASPHP
jgi:eukaryotic-like serine/threonine-protein kinase